MKKVFNSLFVIIAAMVTFAGCAKQEIDAPATPETKTIQFFANSVKFTQQTIQCFLVLLQRCQLSCLGQFHRLITLYPLVFDNSIIAIANHYKNALNDRHMQMFSINDPSFLGAAKLPGRSGIGSLPICR